MRAVCQTVLWGALAALCAPADADRIPTWLTFEQRGEFGTGNEDSDLTLWLPSAGVELTAAGTLGVRASLLGLVSSGTVPDGSAADFGAGGELSLHLVPWPDLPVRPVVHWGIGLLLFPEPFLPGGTRYDGIASFGAGIDVSIADRWTVGANVHSVHLSNGQGLGEHNPAYDGFGVTLGARRTLVPRREGADDSADRASRRGGRASWLPGVTADAGGGNVDGGLVMAGRVRVAQRIAAPLLALADVEIGTLDSEPFSDIGLDLVYHSRVVSFGGHLGYGRFVGTGTISAGGQGELHHDAVSLVAGALYQKNELFGDLWRASLGFRAFPIDDLAVDIGLGFDRIGDSSLDDDHSDPYQMVEWRLPILRPWWQLSLFVERQVSTFNLIGVRGSWGMGSSLRELSRHDGWRRVR